MPQPNQSNNGEELRKIQDAVSSYVRGVLPSFAIMRDSTAWSMAIKYGTKNPRHPVARLICGVVAAARREDHVAHIQLAYHTGHKCLDMEAVYYHLLFSTYYYITGHLNEATKSASRGQNLAEDHLRTHPGSNDGRMAVWAGAYFSR